MSWKAASILAAALIAGLSAPAVAQRDPTRSMRLEGEPSSAEDFRILQRFAHCVADRHARESAAVLAADYRSSAYHSALRRLAQSNPSCVPFGRAKFSGVLFASGMAEALLQRQNAMTDLAARTALDPARPPLQARDETEIMSLCTVRAAPAQVASLAVSDSTSEAESAALRELMPHIGSCLASGRQLQLNRAGLRAILVLAAYRLVQHNAAPPASGN